MPTQLQAWADASNGKVLLGPLKKFHRIFEKTHEDNGGDFSRLLDLCRSSITFTNPRDLLKCFELIIADAVSPGKDFLLADPIKHNGKNIVHIERVKARLCPDWKVSFVTYYRHSCRVSTTMKAYAQSARSSFTKYLIRLSILEVTEMSSSTYVSLRPLTTFKSIFVRFSCISTSFFL